MIIAPSSSTHSTRSSTRYYYEQLWQHIVAYTALVVVLGTTSHGSNTSTSTSTNH
jgi:hypothetical protein